jgi:hypothetical protein
LFARALYAPVNVLRRRALGTEGWASHDVQIRVAFVRVDHEKYAQKVANALGLIARHDPNRLARMKRDLAAILVWPFTALGTVAEFHPELGICALYSAAIKDVPPALVALSIVHEATHARLACIPVTRDNLPRMERLCLEQELAFARRITEGAALSAYVENRITSFDPTVYTKGARVQRGLKELDEAGVPRPLLAIMRLLARLTNGA